MVPPLQLQNAVAVSNLLEQLGINVGGIRFDVVPAVLPVAVIDTTDPLKVDRLAYGNVNTGALAANFSHTQLFNPGGSGKVVHVDSAIIAATAAAIILFAEFNTALTTQGIGLGFRDHRISGQPVAEVREENNALALGDNRGNIAVSLANDAELIPIDVFLEPGEGVVFRPDAQNIGVRTWFFWEEIPR